jgi:hypothetical protein
MMKFSLRELSPLYFRATAMSAGALGLLAWYSAKGVAMKLPEPHRVSRRSVGLSQTGPV